MSKKCYQDNSYYIDVTDSNLDSNPALMDFKNDFGFEDEEDIKETIEEHLVIQTIDKKLSKVSISAPDSSPVEMFEMPNLCSHI